MPTPTWQRLAPARREAVVAAAEQEFAAHGFSHGSLNVIARRAGVAKGSLFQYFTDKADLYAYLSELASVRIRGRLQATVDAQDWSGDFFAALRALVAQWLDYFEHHPLDRAVTAAVNLEPDPAARSAVRRVVNRHYLDVLRPLVELARDSGQLDPGADLEALLAMLLLVLPHLALAPHSPGLDPLLGLERSDPRARLDAALRLLDVLERAYR